MAIRVVTEEAFMGLPFSDQTEARIVQGLRSARALSVSLVADEDGEIFGHVAFSPIHINGVAGDWFGLGPLSVRPDRQRQGTGQMLVRDGLDRLRLMAAAGCVVFGSPEHYRRFGFEHDPKLVYPGAPEGYFMRIVFRGEPPSGEVAYDPAFDAT